MTVSVLNHPEFGTTATRSDGWFDIVVNGGAPYTVQFTANGYMTAQRNATTRWLDWTVLPPIGLVAPEVTTTGTCPSTVSGNPAVTLGSSGWQCVQGMPHGAGQSDDLDPSRTATILIPPGTTIGSCSGTTNCNNSAWTGGNAVTMHATEFTVGDAGRSAMPGDLPPQSAYTYAVEAGIIEAGSTSVNFANSYSNDVFFYLENFTGAPLDANNVTNVVPAGSYDRTRGMWQPEQNGKVYCIMSTTGGLAHMSIDNCTTELTTDGSGNYPSETPSISSGERQELANVYGSVTNKQVWRVPLPHFSSWDLNWNLVGAIGPVPLPTKAPTSSAPVPDPDCKRRSIVECQNQVLGEDLPIYGTPYTLHYRSEAQNGYRPTITVPITDNPQSGFSSLSQIQVEIQVAGQDHDLVVNPPFSPNQTLSWAWDRTDAYGRQVSGQVTATVIVTYIFTAPSFTVSGLTNGFVQYQTSGTANTGNRAERQLVVRKPYYLPVGGIDDKALGFGGWTVSDEHVYEPQSHTLWMGNGEKRVPGRLGDFISTYYFDNSDPGIIYSLAAAADGTVYAAHAGGTSSAQTYLARLPATGVPPLSILSYTADDNHAAFTSGSTPLAQVGLTQGLACVVAGPNQSLYVCNNNRIVAAGPPPSYVATLMAGSMNETPGSTADGNPAAGSSLNSIAAIAFGPDGTLFFAEAAATGNWIRFISADGRLHTVAGNGASGSPTPGALAYGQPLHSVYALAVGNDGVIYAGCSDRHVWAIGKDGIIRNFAGTGSLGALNDNGPATNASINTPGALSLVNGKLLIVDYNDWLVRQVDPSGTITTVAGNGTQPTKNGGYLVDNTIATLGTIGAWHGTSNPDGWYYVNDQSATRIRRFASIGDPVVNGTFEVQSPGGSDVFKFDSTGRHNTTVSEYGGAIQRTLNYDPTSNLLTSIVDGAGNATTIARTSSTVTITAPHGQVTSLGLDANGYLATVTNPATSEVIHLTHANTGLLTQLTDAKGQAHTFTYDGSGLLLKDKTPPASPGLSLARVTPGNGWSVTVSTEQSRSTTYSIDTTPNSSSAMQVEQRTTTDPVGLVTTDTRYSDGSQLITLPDGTKNYVAFASDPRFGFGAPYVSMRTQTTGSHTGGMGTACTANWNANCELSTRTVAPTPVTDPLAITTITDNTYGAFNGYDPNHPYATTWASNTNSITYTTPVGRQVVYSLDALERPVTVAVQGADPVALYPINLTYGVDTSGKGKLETVTQGSRTTTVNFGADGFPATLYTPLLATPTVSFDSRDSDGRLAHETLPGSRVVQMGYDSNGNLASLITPNLNSHGFNANTLDLLGQYVPPAPYGGYWNTDYDYDLDGLLVDFRPPTGNTITYTRDGAGRTSQIAYNHPVSGTVGVTLTYDPTTGHACPTTNPCTATNGSVGLPWVFTADGYDGAMLTSERTWGSGMYDHTVHRSYDYAMRLSSRYLDSNSSASSFSYTSYQYDNDSMISSVSVSSGSTPSTYTVNRSSTSNLLKCTSIGNVCDVYSYNGYGEVTGYTAYYGSNCACPTPSGSVLYSASYNRDTNATGRILNKNETAASGSAYCNWAYSYHPTYQTFLGNASRSGDSMCSDGYNLTMDYDADGNPTAGTASYASYDSQDRQLYDGYWSYAYDTDGNVSSQSVWWGTYNFITDPLGNFRRTSNNAGGATFDYAVDARNRRVEKYNSTSNAAAGMWLWDGDRIVARVNASSPTTIDQYYVYVTKQNVPDLIVTNGALYRVISDQIGSVRMVVNVANGAIAEQMTFDPWGVALSWPGSGNFPTFQPFGFAGGLWDGDAGLWRFGARDYNPWRGRWWKKDPIRFAGGLNLYAYCGNDPVNCIDPTGRGSALWELLDAAEDTAEGGALEAAGLSSGLVLGIGLAAGAAVYAIANYDAPPLPTYPAAPSGPVSMPTQPAPMCSSRPYRTPAKPWSDDIKRCEDLEGSDPRAIALCCFYMCTRDKWGDNSGQCFRECLEGAGIQPK